MSDIIQLLPDSVANQIAAGEVIQRPASVVKELIENAVDAEAKTINVVIIDAGRTLIQVIDDGKGMSETDARLSFERHATSKIRKADDLFALSTMGFRGEALASIAAVARVELKTRQEKDEIGTSLIISGSKFENQEVCTCPVGSNFKIENLFYNVPARRKFLKSNTTELNNIISAFERIVLVYPNISFTLHSNGVEVFSLKACNLRQRIVDVFGKRINQNLLPIDVETTLCRIYGFVGKPESAKKRGALQYFFVNNRYMKHPYFNKAVVNAYERLIPFGEQVPYFLYFEVPAENIDVNIHPTKTEIKFENEQAIWQILMASVKEAVGKFNDIPSIDFDTEGKPDIPVFNPSANINAPSVGFNPTYNPFKETKKNNSSTAQWEELYKELNVGSEEMPSALSSTDEQTLFKPDEFDNTHIEDERSPIHYQYKGCYIITTVKFPEIVNLPSNNEVMLQNILLEMETMGFELSNMGSGSYAVNGIPTGIEGLNVPMLVNEMVTSTIEGESSVKQDIDKKLALSLAQNAAIPHGQVLSNEEMENIVNQLFVCTNVNYTPNGKPILTILKQADIERMFQ